MAINAQKIKLNMVPGGIIPIVHLSQNDIGRVLQFELYDGVSAASITTGTTVTVEGTKPDRHAFQYDATISGNVVTVNTVQQMVIVPGTVECTLTLTYSGQVIGTALFFMEVERSGIADNTDISETVLPVYMEAGRQYMLGSEAWAVGTKNGEPVGSVEPQYNNYSKYYADRAHEDAVISGSAMLIAGQSAESARESAVISGSAMRIAGQSAATAQSAAADALGYKSQASESAAQAAASAIQSAASAATSADAEAWAVGERAGQPVDPGDPTFHNNAKYYAGQAEDAVEYGIVDMVGATNTTNGSHGAAVQPVAGQQNHYLKGDGTWSREDMTVTEITDSAPYLYRASKGGDRQYDELVGGSVVWNQLVQNGDFANNSGWTSNPPSGGVIADNKLTLTNASSTSASIKNNDVIPFVNGHRYLVTYTITPNINTTNTYARLYLSGSLDVSGRAVAVTANNRTVIADVITASVTCNGYVYCYVDKGNGNASVSIFENVNIIDLTAMFGSTIADYINAREIAETGSGIAWIKSYGFFTKDYYAYDTGSILSVNTSGHKLTGLNRVYSNYYINTYSSNAPDYFVLNDDGSITVKGTPTGNVVIRLSVYNLQKGKSYRVQGMSGCTNVQFDNITFTLNGTQVKKILRSNNSSFVVTAPDSDFDAVTLTVKRAGGTMSGTYYPMVYPSDVSGRKYEPYKDPITYPLTSTDLRGILSLSGDDLVYDGDVYESDGTETVKYGYVDLGTLSWIKNTTDGVTYFRTESLSSVIKQGLSRTIKLLCTKYICIDDGRELTACPDKSTFLVRVTSSRYGVTVMDSTYTDGDVTAFTTAMDGVYLVYPLNTPTTATLTPFVTPQICDKDGTEEYIDTRAVPMPVGHYTEYYGVPEWLRDRYLDELREYPYNPTLPVNPTAENIANFKNGSMWVKNANLFVKMANIIHRIPTEPITLVFSSDEAFTLSVATPGWDGTIEYFIDGVNWITWDGSELSGTATQPIYLRGKNNTVITGGSSYKWTFTGKYVTGNIETLLDYQTVARGQHPSMGDYCYYYMFNTCTSLIVAPELPATILAKNCYALMFAICTSLTTAPQLPATTLAEKCYKGMFQSCISLTTAPQLPATTLADYCYQGMFYNCILTNPPELPATTLADYCYYDMFNGCRSLTMLPELPATILTTYCYKTMFKGCTSIKLSTSKVDAYQYEYRIPISDTGTDATDALTDMFTNTGGTFTGTPTINTTYYTDHKPV